MKIDKCEVVINGVEYEPAQGNPGKLTDYIVLVPKPQKSELEKLQHKYDNSGSIFGNDHPIEPRIRKEWWQDGVRIGALALLEYLEKNAYPPRDDRPDRGEIMGIRDVLKLARKWCGK